MRTERMGTAGAATVIVAVTTEVTVAGMVSQLLPRPRGDRTGDVE
ncbi:hypothetical protein [Streptomyces sp. MMG1121]|nr:hypothetical protein [Streptomyces sp. MMG1121]